MLSWIRQRAAQRELATANARAAIAEAMQRERNAQFQSALIAEAETAFFGLDEEKRPLFDPLLYQTAQDIDEWTYRELQRNARSYYHKNGFVYGWINTMTNFVVGAEFKIKARDHDEATQEVWDEFAERERFSGKAYEHVLRRFREGESFPRVFVNPIDGRLSLRFLNPIFVRNDGQHGQFAWQGVGHTASFGIITDPDDYEKILGYVYDTNRRGNYQTISPEEVRHSKMSDSDQKRGWPWVQPVLADVAELEKLLARRRKLHQIRTLYAVNKEITGGPDAVRAIEERLRQNKTDPLKTKSNPVGEVSYRTPGMKVTFDTPNLQATDCDVDIRRHLLKIAVALGFPEYIATGDASNANFASTMVTENPFVQLILAHRAPVALDFEWMFAKVIDEAIRHGTLSKNSFKTVKKVTPSGDLIVSKEPCVRCHKADMLFPNVTHREIDKEVNALVMMRSESLVSRRTAQTRLGLDPDEEDDQLKFEEATAQQNNTGTSAQTEAEALLAKMQLDKSRNGNGNGKPTARFAA